MKMTVTLSLKTWIHKFKSTPIFLQEKIGKVRTLLAKVSKLQSLHSKYQILKLSVNAKLRHLLRSLLPSRPPVHGSVVSSMK